MNFNVREMLRLVADEEGFELEALLAVTEVEGGPVDRLDGHQDGKVNGQVLIRWEGHYFWRHLPEALRLQARRQGLAHPRAGAVKNPRSQSARHKLLAKAMLIDEEAALKSISMGVGQVMGANHRVCGYSSVFVMWADCQILEGQLRCMARFIRGNRLHLALERKDWPAFARGYNGPAYRKNRYAEKLRAAYLKFGGVDSPAPGGFIVGMGHSSPEDVREIQSRLRKLGFPVDVDGDFGPMTRRYVMAFQAENGLQADGQVGAKTREALQNASFTVPEARQQVSARQLAKRSRIASKGLTTRNTALTTASLTAGAKAADETGMLDKLTDKAESVGGAVSAVEPVLNFALSNWWVLPMGALVFVAFWAHGIVSARVEDHHTGKTL